jgi:hypothetical protein
MPSFSEVQSSMQTAKLEALVELYEPGLVSELQMISYVVPVSSVYIVAFPAGQSRIAEDDVATPADETVVEDISIVDDAEEILLVIIVDCEVEFIKPPVVLVVPIELDAAKTYDRNAVCRPVEVVWPV